MPKQKIKKIGILLSLLILVTANAIGINAQGILLINSDIIEMDNSLILDADDTGGDIELQFGNTLNKQFKWDDSGSQFALNDDLSLGGNELKNFRIENLASAPICDSSLSGRVYHNTSDNNTYLCDGTEWDILNSVIDVLPAVQARRATSFSLNAQDTWYDIPFDLTDIETDTSILQHNDTNTERIDVKEDGLYMINYILDAALASTTHGLQGRVYINGQTLLAGSTLEGINYNSEHTPLTATIFAELNNGDYITLQAARLSANTLIGQPMLAITRMEGIKGTQGEQGLPGTVGLGTNENTFTLDLDDTGGDVDLIFGTTVGEYLRYDGSTFTFSDDLNIEGNTLILDSDNVGAGANVSIIANQGSDNDGGIRYNATLNRWEYSNDGGSYAALVSGGGGVSKLFQGIDSTGAMKVTNVSQPIPFEYVSIKDDYYSHSTTVNPSEVTILTEGWYAVDAMITVQTLSASEGNRGNPVMHIEVDSGSGWVEMPDSTGGYIRENAAGQLSASLSGSGFFYFNENDVIRITIYDTVVVEPDEATVAYSSRLVLNYEDRSGSSSGTVDNLKDIGDVNANAPSDGQVLTFDTTTSKWLPGSVDAGTNSNTFTLDLDDTGGNVDMIFGTTVAQYLRHDGTLFTFSDDVTVTGDLSITGSLTGATIDGDLNTLQDIDSSSLKTRTKIISINISDMTVLPDGTNNLADLYQESELGVNPHEYYLLKTTQGTLQDLDIKIKVKLPEDFVSFANSDDIKFNYKNTGVDNTDSKIDILVEDDDGDDAYTAAEGQSLFSTIWALFTNEYDGGSFDPAAGENIYITIKGYASYDVDYQSAYLGEIVLTYTGR